MRCGTVPELRRSAHHVRRLIAVAALALADGFFQPGKGDSKRSNKNRKLIRFQLATRSQGSGGIADGPPGRTLWRIPGALRGGVEDLAIRISAERG